MSVITIADIAYVRFTAPDLEAMRIFLEDFGLQPALWEDGALYARGAGEGPFLHATALGPPAFAALGLRAHDVQDLERLAASEGVSVDPLHAPGGGFLVALEDPDGYRVEVVAGQALATPQAVPPPPGRNTADCKARVRAPVRVKAQPSTVVRLGHAVLDVADFRRSEAWYKARFGFLTSDEIHAGPNAPIGAFLRCDLGDTPTDHHTLFLLQSPQAPRFNHAAFEVADLDDLMAGHAHLKRARRTATWGVGRHLLGSQVFDYWRDPFGHELEHWTDGDLFTAADAPKTASLMELLAAQWGPNHPLMAAAEDPPRP